VENGVVSASRRFPCKATVSHISHSFICATRQLLDRHFTFFSFKMSAGENGPSLESDIAKVVPVLFYI
jgi:hypothetical protein